MTDVEVTFPQARSENEGPVTIFGRVVARAYGRDSAARIGEGVVFVKGKAFSRCDHKGWRTVVGEGSVVRMGGVPRDLVVPGLPPGGRCPSLSRQHLQMKLSAFKWNAFAWWLESQILTSLGPGKTPQTPVTCRADGATATIRATCSFGIQGPALVSRESPYTDIASDTWGSCSRRIAKCKLA